MVPIIDSLGQAKGYGWGSPSSVIAIGIFGGGATSCNSTTMTTAAEYITFSSLGNSISWGNLTTQGRTVGGMASTTRGLFAGGGTHPVAADTSIGYATFATTGSYSSFGSLNDARWGAGASGSSTRGIIGGGFPGGSSGSSRSSIEYVTIATTGNAISFGSLTVGGHQIASVSSPTRAVWGKRDASGSENSTQDYVTIATTGNATNFGTATIGSSAASLSSNTRGIWATSAIEYITIATTGNAISFGNCQVAVGIRTGLSNSITGVLAGGCVSNALESFTIATTGNSTTFGNIITARELGSSGSSNAHGGIAA
jgi:hypothetical protein